LWRLLPESSRFEKADAEMRGWNFFTPFRALATCYPERFAMISGAYGKVTPGPHYQAFRQIGNKQTALCSGR
jgi:hypothetical protein